MTEREDNDILGLHQILRHPGQVVVTQVLRERSRQHTSTARDYVQYHFDEERVLETMSTLITVLCPQSAQLLCTIQPLLPLRLVLATQERETFSKNKH